VNISKRNEIKVYLDKETDIVIIFPNCPWPQHSFTAKKILVSKNILLSNIVDQVYLHFLQLNYKQNYTMKKKL